MLAVLRSFSLRSEKLLAEIANENNDSRVNITFNRAVHFVSRISDAMKEKLIR